MRTLCLFLLVCFMSVAFAADEYLPLAPGLEWIMDATIVTPDGKVSKATGRRKVGGTEERDGKVYHRSFTSMEGGPFPVAYTRFSRKDEAGVYSLDGDEKDAKEQKEIALPLTVGQSWKRMMGPIEVTDTVVAVEDVTIRDTTFKKCFHIRTAAADGSYTEDFWEAPVVGNVKSEITWGNGMKITLTLREFKTGK